MSASVNRVILQGNLGRDPELRFSPDGLAICNVSIATQYVQRDKATGEKTEKVEWHRVVLYGKQAEMVSEYSKKGDSLYIEGRNETRKWQDKDTGADRYSTEVIAEAFKFNSSRGEQGDSPQQTQRPAQRQQPSSKPASNFMDMDDAPF